MAAPIADFPATPNLNRIAAEKTVGCAMDIYTVRKAKPEEQRELTRLYLAPIQASACVSKDARRWVRP
jgi:hypothetical protein